MYVIYRVFKEHNDKEILHTHLTRDEAISMVNNDYPSEENSMVVFDKMPHE